MLFAYDCNDNRTHIDNTKSKQEYFCPYCGTPLITKKGDIRQHHFAHKATYKCRDTWERNKSYDMSPWHNEWQECFPKDNQEIMLSLGEVSHRADVLIGRTVVEFQRSTMAVNAFDERNNFYFNLNYKVVWLFDLSKEMNDEKLTCSTAGDGLSFKWKNPRKAFNSYDVKIGSIDLFFQLSDTDKDCIVRVMDVSTEGFEDFTASPLMTKEAFLAYVGLNGGVCAAPDRTDFETNERYLRFKEKYHIRLNRQQERAVQSIEGAVSLLAVPGSGKTTVLVDRLGYMVCEKKIAPESILALTYTKEAAEEMKTRFCRIFGEAYGKRIEFRTINSLSLEIYSHYCKTNRREEFRLVKESNQRDILEGLYKKYNPEQSLSESNFICLKSEISYAKNMRLDEKKVAERDSLLPGFSKISKDYRAKLKARKMMDYDDQVYFAYIILTRFEDQAVFWQKKYRYICVDEAQDTSKIQHEIIRILAKGNNIFMVGDEDQSIYGFRGAYPKALLNFRADYNNPYILRMERNYRSTPQIVEKAQSFISENTGRYEKTMVAERGDGNPVHLVRVNSVEEQYLKALEAAKAAQNTTAFLYRDNNSAVVLFDLFLRNGIDFRLKKPEKKFFTSSIVRDIAAFLTLIIAPYDKESWKYVRKRNLQDILRTVQRYYKLPKEPESVIQVIWRQGYKDYLQKRGYEYESKIEPLLVLAKQEQTIEGFLARLQFLEKQFGNGFENKSAITLSTIHSSKGLEYEAVHILDVYDDRFPSSPRNIFNASKDNADGEQEERRIFYVGLTRAKDELFLYSIKDKPSEYIESLFPEIMIENDAEKRRTSYTARTNSKKLYSTEMHRYTQEKLLREEKQEKSKQDEAKKEKTDSDYYDEVKERFDQQDTPIRDSRGKRWVKCEICGQILPEEQFSSCGGPNHVNLGVCGFCQQKERELKKLRIETDEEF